MTKNEVINPWGSDLPENYKKIIKDFGLEKFDIKDFQNQIS